MAIGTNKLVRFSQKVINGSVSDRNYAVRKLSDKIFEGVLEKRKGNEIPISDINHVLSNSLPEETKIRLKKIKRNAEEMGGQDFIIDDRDNFIGQEITLPMKKHKLQIEDVPLFMHEITHALDNLFNPKTTQRLQKGSQNRWWDNGFDLYEKEIYKKEKYSSPEEKKQIIDKAKWKIKRFLSGKPTDEKLDYIQNIRYYLQSEQNAYRADNLYARQLKNSDSDYNIDIGDFHDGEEQFLFEEKLTMLKSLGGEIISKFRQKHAK